MSATALRRRVLLSGTMLMAAAVGYGRRAYAACVNNPPGSATYECSGANPATQTITHNNASVFTDPGFSVTTAAGNAITITGNGALSYTDVNASSLTAAGTALYVRSGSDYAGTPGSVTIATNGTLGGGSRGIDARNFGIGALTITASGDITATGRYGIYARNNTGTDLTVTTGAGTTVSGGVSGIFVFSFGTGALSIRTNGDVTGTARYGIFAENYGSGALTITANGNVTGTNGIGIYARNGSRFASAGTDLTVTTATGTTVNGGYTGIIANNTGTGALTVTANGNVSGTAYYGISARNSATATNLTVTTGAGTTISGASAGIRALNYGTGALTITANGDVTGTCACSSGILAVNYGTALSVTTTANTRVSGGNYGIRAANYGTGALTIKAYGNVTATTYQGIFVRNGAYGTPAGTDLTVITGGTVSGGAGAIYARNYGTGVLSITANGDVSASFGTGIYARNINGTDLRVTTGANTTVSGTTGINALNYGSGALAITANGNVTGTTDFGIFATNFGTALSVTTGAGTTVSGASAGIFALNYGTGALTITANGDVTGTCACSSGILAVNYGNGLSVTTGAGTTVSGRSNGIAAINYGTGALTITANGNVTGGTGDGIYALSGGAPIAVTVGATGSVTSNGGAASAFGIETKGAAATVTVAGTVNGGAGGAVKFDQTGVFANRLELVSGAVINGNVLGGPGTDTLGLSGSGSGSFNVAQLNSFEAGAKTGSGMWTLTGTNAEITTFSVAGGTFNVNGSLSNAAFTVSGGTLAGTGTVGNTSIAGGTFAPGSGAPGTSMTVNGTLGFNAASTFAVNVNPTTASFANVSGAATLGGATVNAIFANGSYISKQYTILNAASINGSFGTLTNTNLPANFTDTLSYDATHAYLNLALSFIPPSAPNFGNGLSGNQQGVANALINFFNTNGGIPMVFGSLTPNGLSQAAGQPGADVGQAGIGGVGQFVNGVFDNAFDDNGGQGGAPGFAEENSYAPKPKVSREAKEAYAAVTPRDRLAPSFASRWNVWAAGYGGNARVNGDAAAGTSTTTSRIFGAAAGATYHFTPDTQVGFSLGGAGSSFSLDGGFGSGKADAFNAAAYAKHNWGAAYVAGLLGYSWQDMTTDRTLTIAGVDQLHAAFKAQALSARLEGGWRYATPMLGITPFAALQSTSFHLPGYAESATSGSNTFALSYASKTVQATRSEFGTKFDRAMLVQGGLFTLKAKTAWAHDWNADRSAIATFQTLPGATFTTNGARPSANAALASLGAEMKWHNGWTLAGSFDGEFSRTTAAYAGKGAVKYAW